jgi:hypothetical protein
MEEWMASMFSEIVTLVGLPGQSLSSKLKGPAPNLATQFKQEGAYDLI